MGILLSPKEKKGEKFSPASSFISLVEYDEKNRTMDISFHTGSKIRYIYVFPATYESFKRSPVHSAFYARAIKGNLPSIKIIENGIGQKKSTPLKHVTKGESLDTGIRKQRAHDKRINGTLSRIFNATVA